MARLADLQLKYRLFLQLYPYRRIDWRPGARLAKPLPRSRIALITSAGFYESGQSPFNPSIRGGDWSFREISADTEVRNLRIGQQSAAFDHSGIEEDRNLALPLDRLRELVEAGDVGEVSPRHFSMMGSISAPGRLISRSAPEILHKLREDKVDAVFLTPVWPMCHQSVGLVQSVIEKGGIPTVSITLLLEVTTRVSPPRALIVDRPLGYPLGEPNHPNLQKAVMLEAFSLLERPIAKPLVAQCSSV